MDVIHATGKRQRRVLRVDFTPLVDLGFLLITFFVFTSQLSTPSAMQAMWPKEGDSTKIAASGAITIIPDDKGYYYYAGALDEATLHFIAAKNIQQLRDMLSQAKLIRTASPNKKDKLMVIIKPTAAATFGRVVSVLDEMTIGVITSYTITDIAAAEMQAVANANL